MPRSYVAGSVLDQLLKEDRYDISATSRRDEVLERLAQLGVRGVKASLDDADDIRHAAAESDVIINGASSDHAASVDATLQAIEERSAKGLKTI